LATAEEAEADFDKTMLGNATIVEGRCVGPELEQEAIGRLNNETQDLSEFDVASREALCVLCDYVEEEYAVQLSMLKRTGIPAAIKRQPSTEEIKAALHKLIEDDSPSCVQLSDADYTFAQVRAMARSILAERWIVFINDSAGPGDLYLEKAKSPDGRKGYIVKKRENDGSR
jgi:hypothetical protein